MTEATRFEPPVTETTAPFWEATKENRLLLQWCTACDKPIFYPREVCPSCMGSALEWRDSTGRGTIYAVSVQHKAQNPLMADRAPYAVVLVELDEGVRILSNGVGREPYEFAVGQQVQVTWEPLSDGRNLPQFERSEP
jgi:uncharacterized OB-fold protein